MTVGQRIAIILVALAAGCSPMELLGPHAERPHAAPPGGAPQGACPDDGPRLPGTGICAGRAHAYLNLAEGPAPRLPAGCDWVTNETMIADGSEALLYRAARCRGVTTALSVSIGAESAAVDIATSALEGARAEGRTVIRIFTPDSRDPARWVEALARETTADPTRRRRCAIRPAGHPAWPADARVVALEAPHEAAFRRAAAQGGPRAACGPYGLAYGDHAYWRLFQGRAWFFQLGQGAQEQGPAEIDPRSITWILRDPQGGWSAPE